MKYRLTSDSLQRSSTTTQEVQDSPVPQIAVSKIDSHLDGRILQEVNLIRQKTDGFLNKPEASKTPTRYLGSNMVTSSTQGRSSSTLSGEVCRTFMQKSLHLAIDNLMSSDLAEELIINTVHQTISSELVCSGVYNADECTVHTVSVPKGVSCQKPNIDGLKDFVFIHQTSLRGFIFGNMWVRKSKVYVKSGSRPYGGKVDVKTSFLFYPARWLTKFGFCYAVEASFSGPNSLYIRPIRAVPDNALIFDFCRRGNISAVQTMLQRGDASTGDTSSKGWTPLHVSISSPKRLFLL